jgi:hypothetical protein
MARGAVTLGVARRTRLETLACCLPVPKAEPAKCVVVSFRADSPCGDETRLPMASLAKLSRIVTIAAVRVASVSRARVTREEIRRVVARLPRNFRAVTLETCRAHVAGLAGSRAGIGLGRMSFPEVPGMTRRWRARPPRRYHSPCCCGRHRSDCARHRSNVTARATLSCVTARARHRSGVRLRAVPFLEVPRVSRWFGTCQQRAGRAARAGSRERRDRARRHPDVAARAALPHMASRACRGRLLRQPAMCAEKIPSRVARRHGQRSRVHRGPFVECEGGDHRRLRGVHMAGDAKIPRVACGAARRDADFIGGSPGQSCESTVTAKPKIRRVMRAGTREARNVGASQTGRVGQPHVTRRTCLARNIKVRIFQSVTAETLSDDCIAHHHPGRSRLVVTRGAIPDQGAVCRILHGHGAVMILMSEAPVPRPRSLARLPRHLRLDDAIVTRCALYCLRKHRLSWLYYPGMTSGTKRKHLGMLFMGEPLRCTANKRRRKRRPGREDANGKRGPKVPNQCHRSVGRAGGSGVRSAPDPNARLTPARTRNWSSDDALASGRSRSSPTIEKSPHTRR